MSDPTAQEPTMEEILASIRRIISEDDAPAAEPTAATAVEEHEEPRSIAAEPAQPTHLAAVAPVDLAREDEDDEILDLTEPALAPKETHGDLDVFDAEPAPKAPEPAPEPVKAAPPPPEPLHKPAFSAPVDEDRLISGGAEDRAASHFGLLSQSVAMPAAGRNLEDVVSALLKPLLKDWLDQHLPAIVEEKVQAEVERISRRRV